MPRITWVCALCHADDIPRSRSKRDLCEDCVPALAARGLAWCARGGHRVDATAMISASVCRACEATRKAAQYQRRKDELQARALAHYHAHADAYKARRARWYAANRERERERQRAYRARTIEQQRARCRAWRNANPERAAASQAAWRAAHPERPRLYQRHYYQQQKLRAWRGMR